MTSIELDVEDQVINCLHQSIYYIISFRDYLGQVLFFYQHLGQVLCFIIQVIIFVIGYNENVYWSNIHGGRDYAYNRNLVYLVNL